VVKPVLLLRCAAFFLGALYMPARADIISPSGH